MGKYWTLEEERLITTVTGSDTDGIIERGPRMIAVLSHPAQAPQPGNVMHPM